MLWRAEFLQCRARRRRYGTRVQATGTDMNTYVILFRQGPRQLGEAELQRRAEETSLWARTHNAAGHKLQPHILAPERATRGGQPPQGVESWPVTALLLLEARDLEEAARVAELHPAIHYGAGVEVRPWALPATLRRPAAS